MRLGTVVKPVVGFLNAGMSAILGSPRLSWLLNRHIVVITYTGRRSGRTFSTPVGYRRVGDQVLIGVSLPDAKTWWRNFLGAGGPMSLKLNGTDRSGHAVAQRDDQGRVTVTVTLDAV